MKILPYPDLFIDFDDTLYDTHGNAVVALSELFDALNLDQYFDEPQEFYDTYWEANIDLWKQYSKGNITRDYLIVERFRRPLSHGRGLNVSEEYCLKVSDMFLEFCATKPGLVEGAREIVDYLKGRGYNMHLCSNGFHEVQYRKLQACGLNGCFNTVILSEDAGYNKPDIRFFSYALQVSGASPKSTLMIGDNFDTDILGAQQAGLDTVFFNRFPEWPAPQPVNHLITSLLQLKDIL